MRPTFSFLSQSEREGNVLQNQSTSRQVSIAVNSGYHARVMRDRLTKERRSWNMSRIRGKNTTPEKRVRSHLHRMGYRFRLHRKDLPGNPDIVFVNRRIACSFTDVSGIRI